MKDNSRLGIYVLVIALAVIIALVFFVHFFLNSFTSKDEFAPLIDTANEQMTQLNTVEQPALVEPSTTHIDLSEEQAHNTNKQKTFVEQDKSYTAHTPHPWELVEVSPVQAQLCRDMELTPLTYKEVFDSDSQETKRVYSDYYELNLSILHNDREYSIASVYNEGTEKWLKAHMKDYLDRVYDTYSEWLGPEKLFKTQINIKLALNQTQYFNALAEHDAEESAKVQGVYLPWLHTAFVKIPHNERNQIIGMRLLQVLVHESVHAINFVQFGYMHRWAQEGLAQYFTHFVETRTPELFLSYEQWERRSESLAEPLSFQDVIEPSGHWLENRSALYASSFAYVQYFSNLEKSENKLITLLNTELKQRCSVLKKGWSKTHLDPNDLLYTNIQNWFEHTVIYHSQRADELEKEIQNSRATH
ncbi:hypothetical protein C1E23_09470 [Pseudoalteromonas phenolica]|uniref:DUF1570 domain-containing protein n=1 Tax=Pseudoalteromonas phenolica TaxID=161398 RepID=A0A4V2EJR8_9GAMM|nr:hypothetical protein [Pseudoalteromonas phenolica]RZQ53298.1 hypothetical protein C1E23_09470 [Pseudoalteromonas phenolica]